MTAKIGAGIVCLIIAILAMVPHPPVTYSSDGPPIPPVVTATV